MSQELRWKQGTGKPPRGAIVLSSQGGIVFWQVLQTQECITMVHDIQDSTKNTYSCNWVNIDVYLGEQQ